MMMKCRIIFPVRAFNATSLNETIKRMAEYCSNTYNLFKFINLFQFRLIREITHGL